MSAPGSTRRLFFAGVATTLLCAVMYWIPQHWGFTAPLRLPLTAIDRAVPFWPLTGLLYYGAFVFLVASFVALRGDRAWHFLRASLIAQAIGMLCFLFWPTEYPRELYPTPAGTSALGAALVAFVRSHDGAMNCLPSLHVCTATLCVLALRGSRWFMPALLAALPLVASTLTFKQHYFADVITGALLGFASWWLAGALQARRNDSRVISAGP